MSVTDYEPEWCARHSRPYEGRRGETCPDCTNEEREEVEKRRLAEEVEPSRARIERLAAAERARREPAWKTEARPNLLAAARKRAAEVETRTYRDSTGEHEEHSTLAQRAEQAGCTPLERLAYEAAYEIAEDGETPDSTVQFAAKAISSAEPPIL